jgi:hypothetical protein
MRTRVSAGLLVVAVGVLAVGVVPASAKTISSSQLKTLENNLAKGKHITYEATYKSVQGAQTQTVTIAQAPPKSNFSTSGGEVVDTGSKTFYCSTQGSAETCINAGTSNPFLGLEDIFSSSTALGAFAEAKEGLIARALGVKVTESSGSFGGQASSCVTVTVKGKGGKYCVTKQGILSYSGGASSYFELVKFSTSPPASLFALPAGATTETLPGGVSIP